MSLRHQLDQLPLEDVTDEHVRAALLERISEMHGYPHMDPDEYWSDLVLPSYREALEWWPRDAATDAPPAARVPALSELCFHVAGTTNPERLTALEHLTNAGQRCVSWLVSIGRDPAHPNESKRDAQRRRAAGAMRRSRALQRDAARNPAAERVRELHAAYIAACQARKEAVAVVTEQHRPIVDAAHDAWLAARDALSAPSDA